MLAWALIAAGLLTISMIVWRAVGHAWLERQERRGRSLVLITVDTTRADQLGPYGGPVPTPAIQRLANQGILFEKAYSTAPITLVAHTTLMSGLYPPEHGVRNNGLHAVPDTVETLAERLSGRGYRTAAFVSASVLERRYGLDQGFEVYDDDLSAGRERHRFMVPDRPAGATIDAALAWLDTLADKESFFLWVHLYDPHAPYSPPDSFAERFPGQPYLGEIAYMDSQTERLLGHPRLAVGSSSDDASGNSAGNGDGDGDGDGDENPDSADANTVVALIGDHGESLGEHGEQSHALLAYDSTLHVPFLLHIPGGPAGVRVKAPVGHVDVFPTLLGALGLGAPKSGHGRDLLAAGQPDDRSPSPLYSETYLPHYTYGWAKLKVVRRGNLKYIEAPRPELYDLRGDPRELTNQWEQQPGPAHDLARDLAELEATFDDPELESRHELDAESVEKLRSLGYLAAGSAQQRAGPAPDPKELVFLHTGLERARQLARDELWELAQRQLEEVLAKDPQNLAALLGLAEAMGGQGKLAEALGVTERALALDPGSPRIQLQMAAYELRLGRLDRALALYDLILESDHTSLDAQLQKGAVLARSGRQAEARESLQKALGDHPEHPRALLLHAIHVDLADGDRPAAEARLRQAVERDPFLAAAWRRLGDLLASLGRQDEALRAYRSGLERQPSNAELHIRLARLLVAKGDPQRRFHLEEAVRLSSANASDLLLSLAEIYRSEGQESTAKGIFERLANGSPQSPSELNNRALALFALGRVGEARQGLEDLLLRWPQHLDALSNLAAVASEMGDGAAAEAAARAVLEQRTDLPEVWNNLGAALESQGRPSEALEAYARALQVDAGYWQAKLNRGLLLASTAPEAAAVMLEEVLDGAGPGPDQRAELHRELARIYGKLLAKPDLARRHDLLGSQASSRNDFRPQAIPNGGR